jgi:outer membrane protein TolC
LLRARSRTLVQLYRDERDDARTAARILASFLQLQAAHQEELGAASAMRAYYTRIALVEQLQLNEAALKRVDAEEEKQRSLVEQGLPAGSDLSAFARQRIEIADQRLQLESQDLQLRNLLVQLTKINALCHGVQGERLDVQPQTLDCARLKQIALAGRHDLRGWRLLAKSVDSASAPEFAKMIPTLVGGWSLPTPSIGSLKLLLCPPDTSGLAANMKRELELTVAQQVDWICQSVDQKCHQLELSYRRIELAKQTVVSWRARREQLMQLQAAGGGQPEQLAVAQAELLKAQAAEVSRRLDGRLAEIDLAEATGGLAERCRSGAAWLSTGR